MLGGFALQSASYSASGLPSYFSSRWYHASRAPRSLPPALTRQIPGTTLAFSVPASVTTASVVTVVATAFCAATAPAVVLGPRWPLFFLPMLLTPVSYIHAGIGMVITIHGATRVVWLI